MTRTAGVSIKATASRAASSGRQRITRSAAFRCLRRVAGSLRSAGSMDATFRSARAARRAWIWSPVVPASPSMKTVGIMALAFAGNEKSASGGPRRSSRISRGVRLLALGELEAASRLRLAVLLALDHPAVAGQEAVRLENG